MDMIANIFLFLNDGRSTYCAYLIMSKSYHISQGGFKAVQDEAPGYSYLRFQLEQIEEAHLAEGEQNR